MAFGKPKNPLLDEPDQKFIDFQANNLEAKMLHREARVAKCGCIFIRTSVKGGTVLRACELHAKKDEEG